MNENIDLRQILKDYPKGTKLYSPLFGEVEFDTVLEDTVHYPIAVRFKGKVKTFMADGRFLNYEDSECMLFPTKGIRDWEFWLKMTTQFKIMFFDTFCESPLAELGIEAIKVTSDEIERKYNLLLS